MRGHSAVAAILLSLGLTACVSSEQPFVTERGAHFAPELVGTWSNADSRERAVITRAGPAHYTVVYTDDRGETRQFTGRLGRAGRHHILDLESAVPPSSDGDAPGAHLAIVLDTIAPRVTIALLEPDSLKAHLARHPRAVATRRSKDELVFTAGTAELAKFLADYLQRPGALSDRSVWTRTAP